jgi:hypothetical protein
LAKLVLIKFVMRNVILYLALVIISLCLLAGCDSDEEQALYNFNTLEDYTDWKDAHTWVISFEFAYNYMEWVESDTLFYNVRVDNNDLIVLEGAYTLNVNGTDYPLHYFPGYSSGSVSNVPIPRNEPAINVRFSHEESNIIEQTVTRPEIPEAFLNDYFDINPEWPVDRIVWTLTHASDIQLLHIWIQYAPGWEPYSESFMVPSLVNEYNFFVDYSEYFSARVKEINVKESGSNLILVSTEGIASLNIMNSNNLPPKNPESVSDAVNSKKTANGE